MKDLKVQTQILSAALVLSLFCSGCGGSPVATTSTAAITTSYETEETAVKNEAAEPSEEIGIQDTSNVESSIEPTPETQVATEQTEEPQETGTAPQKQTLPTEPTIPPATDSGVLPPETSAPPATQSTEPTVSDTTAPPETSPSTEAATEPPTEKETIDLSVLSQYGIDYAVSTYGYEYWPGMRDGWYPPATFYIPDMEHGYAAVAACVDSLTRTLEARGESIVEYVDGVAYGMPFDIEIVPDPDGFEDSYLIYTYY